MPRNYGRVLFWLFIGIFMLFVFFGFGAAIAAILGYVDWTKGSVGAIIGCLGTAIGVTQIKPIFIEAMKREVIPSEAIGRLEEQLKEYFRSRLGMVRGAGELKDDRALADISKRLMQHFLESALRLKAPDAHFEISVFANVNEPEIVCYYDSGGSSKPSSAQFRAENSQYYRDKGYEAVELLENPSGNGDVIVISRTEKSGNYSFVNDEQKARIKSTCLCSFTDPEPIVIVLVANREGIFDEADTPLKNLVTTALMSVAFERKFYKAIRIPKAYMGKRQDVSFVPEPDPSVQLHQMLTDKSIRAVELEEWILRERHRLRCEAVRASSPDKVIILDRTMSEDRNVFFQLHHKIGLIDDQDLARLNKLSDELDDKALDPQLTIFFSADELTLRNRFLARSEGQWLLEHIDLQLTLYNEFRQHLKMAGELVVSIDTSGLAPEALPKQSEACWGHICAIRSRR